MKEYWNRPDATEEAFEGDWFKTGDIAEIDDDGFVYIKDRIKDMIISSGENVYPAEVEAVIQTHPAVREVAVIGKDDDKWGETVHAVIVASQADLSEQAILDHCQGELSRYKQPRVVSFVEELPRNASGKVLKKDLRLRFENG
jgi:acyl-CoA synthetase (AMP-forming)/AMP-acid ligase II